MFCCLLWARCLLRFAFVAARSVCPPCGLRHPARAAFGLKRLLLPLNHDVLLAVRSGKVDLESRALNVESTVEEAVTLSYNPELHDS